MPILCKFCGVEAPSFEVLKNHARDYHVKSFLDVQKYLGDVDEKEVLATRLIVDGMKGYDAGVEKDPESKW